MAVPRSLDGWTLPVIKDLVDTRTGEDDTFDFKEVLKPSKPDTAEFNVRLVATACSFANTAGGFLLFGVKANVTDGERVVGIPKSEENAKVFSEKVHRAEPSLNFDTKSIEVDDDRVVFVVEIRPAARGPHWDTSCLFWKRSQGRKAEMTHQEVQQAFINYSERVARLHLVFISLVENWIRLQNIAQHAESDEVTLATVGPD